MFVEIQLGQMDRFSRILNFKDFGGKYFRFLKIIISLRFLYEFVVPQDIFSVSVTSMTVIRARCAKRVQAVQA